MLRAGRSFGVVAVVAERSGRRRGRKAGGPVGVGRADGRYRRTVAGAVGDCLVVVGRVLVCLGLVGASKECIGLLAVGMLLFFASD